MEDNILDSNYSSNFDYIIKFLNGDIDAKTACNAIGMSIPKSFRNDKEKEKDYLLAYHTMYDACNNNNKYFVSIYPIKKDLLKSSIEANYLLSTMNDIELFTNFFYISFDDRADLLQTIIDHIYSQNSAFFYPIRKNKNYIENTHTISGSQIDEKVLMIGYGKYNKYYMYELDDFIGAFNPTNNTLFSFRYPNNYREHFTQSAIDGLMQLLDILVDLNIEREKIHRLQNIITYILNVVQSNFEKILVVKEKYDMLSAENKKLMHDILLHLIDIGMYMRRWKGPGHHYPINGRQTTGADPEKKVQEEMVKLEQMFNSETKKIFDELIACNYILRSKIGISDELFLKTYDEIVRGSYCIRMASTIVIGTAYKHLQVFENYKDEQLETMDMII